MVLKLQQKFCLVLNKGNYFQDFESIKKSGHFLYLIFIQIISRWQLALVSSFLRTYFLQSQKLQNSFLEFSILTLFISKVVKYSVFLIDIVLPGRKKNLKMICVTFDNSVTQRGSYSKAIMATSVIHAQRLQLSPKFVTAFPVNNSAVLLKPWFHSL